MFASLRLNVPLLLLMFIVGAAERRGVGGGICAEILFAPCPDHSRHLHTFAAAPLRPKWPALEHST